MHRSSPTQSVTSLENLLERGATPQGRKDLAEATDISGALILEWVNRADLFPGQGYRRNTLTSGIRGCGHCTELANRNGANLYEKLKEVNDAKKLVRRLPTKSQVEGWVAAAKELSRKVSY